VLFRMAGKEEVKREASTPDKQCKNLPQAVLCATLVEGIPDLDQRVGT
jgi:hypothetical protein